MPGTIVVAGEFHEEQDSQAPRHCGLYPVGKVGVNQVNKLKGSSLTL